MRRYHSVYLTSGGAVYTCGHGRGGRLGLGHEEPTLVCCLLGYTNDETKNVVLRHIVDKSCRTAGSMIFSLIFILLG